MVKLFKLLPALMALAGVLSLFLLTRPASL
jgi:hypothetical protein